MNIREIQAGHQRIVSEEDFVNALKRSNDRPVFHVVLQVCCWEDTFVKSYKTVTSFVANMEKVKKNRRL